MPVAEDEQAAADIKVSVARGEIPKAFWKGPSGKAWRIPHDWRRRRIKLPDYEGLLWNRFPRYLVKEFGGPIVTVNYDPGSLCCLHDAATFGPLTFAWATHRRLQRMMD